MPSGPAIDIWYGPSQRFGHAGRAQRWINIVGRARSDAGIDSMRWRLGDDGRFAPLPFGPSAYRLLEEGDFNIEIDGDALPPGAHHVEISAMDRAGRDVHRRVEIHHHPSDEPPPLPRVIDWNSAHQIQDVAQVVDGHWRIEDGAVRPVRIGYDRLLAVGDARWTDYQLAVPLTLHRFNDARTSYRWPSGGPGVGVLLRWQGHYDWHDLYPRRGWHPIGGIAWYRWDAKNRRCRLQLAGNRGQPIAEDPAARQIPFGRPHILRCAVRSRPGSTAWYAMKLWSADESEPDDWDLQGHGHEGELSAGSALLLAHHTDATFGAVRIDPI